MYPFLEFKQTLPDYSIKLQPDLVPLLTEADHLVLT